MDREDYSRLYITRRFEEQRSKLAQIKSSFHHLTQNIEAIQYSFISPPPILYSEIVFNEYESRIKKLEMEFKKLDESNDYEELVRLNKYLSGSISDLVEILLCFQHLNDQRISGLNTLKTLEYQPNQQSEYGSIGKVYNSVDALCYELTKKCFGEEWILSRQYVPLSVFGQVYSMRPLTKNGAGSLITVPYQDCFRARFWPILAHEIAHAKVALAKKLWEPLFECIMNEVDGLDLVLFSDITDKTESKKIADYLIIPELTELVSDIIAAYICGPAYLFASSISLSFLARDWSSCFYDAVRKSQHPPIEVRLAAMQEVLERLNVPVIILILMKLLVEHKDF